jgi:IS5 family transposase
VWFTLADEGVEDAINDNYAMRIFMGIDFMEEQVPDATILLHFRNLLEKKESACYSLTSSAAASKNVVVSCTEAPLST